MVLIKVREKLQEGVQRVGRVMRMADLWRVEGMAGVRIEREGEHGVVGIGPEEATDEASSKLKFFVVFSFDPTY